MANDTPRFGRYEIVSELGRGAMGVVYKARDPMLDRLVAIKTIDVSLEGSEAAQYQARFQQEARAAGGLNHPNIVTIHDVGNSGGVAFMAMEYIDGTELRALLVPGTPFDPARAASIAAQVAEGLAYAHERGVVHRDIKPPNIMVLASGLVKITDFGIARVRSSQLRTQTGHMMGSPKYMSPEQVTGLRVDHRSDLFSLGIILYEMLTGAAPFTGESLAALMYQTVQFAPPAPSVLNAAVPEVLDAIAAKLLAKKAEDRYQSAAEVAADLRACERQLAAGGAGEPATPLATFSPGSLPAPIDLEATGLLTGQGTAHTRQDDDSVTIPEPLTPSRGLARVFDSQEATQRLAKLTAMTTPPATLVQPPAAASRGWGRRDALVLGVTTLAALVIAALILGT